MVAPVLIWMVIIIRAAGIGVAAEEGVGVDETPARGWQTLARDVLTFWLGLSRIA